MLSGKGVACSAESTVGGISELSVMMRTAPRVPQIDAATALPGRLYQTHNGLYRCANLIRSPTLTNIFIPNADRIWFINLRAS
jgi:hypothetical protein